MNIELSVNLKDYDVSQRYLKIYNHRLGQCPYLTESQGNAIIKAIWDKQIEAMGNQESIYMDVPIQLPKALTRTLPFPIHLFPDGKILIHPKQQMKAEGAIKRMYIVEDIREEAKFALLEATYINQEEFEHEAEEERLLKELKGVAGVMQLHACSILKRPLDKQHLPPRRLFVTELQQGTLNDLLRAQEKMDFLFFATQLFKAIANTHERGILHRDIHPGNILYKSSRVESKITLCDFGGGCDENDEKRRAIPRSRMKEISPEHGKAYLWEREDIEAAEKDNDCGTSRISDTVLYFRKSKMIEASAKAHDIWMAGCTCLQALWGSKSLIWFDGEGLDKAIQNLVALPEDWLLKNAGMNMEQVSEEELPTPVGLLYRVLQVDPLKRCSATQALEYLDKLPKENPVILN